MSYDLLIEFVDGNSLKLFGLTSDEAKVSKASFRDAPDGFWIVRNGNEKHYFQKVRIDHIIVTAKENVLPLKKIKEND